MLARRFLYVIAVLIVLVLLAGLGWSLFQDRLMRAAFVPSVPFADAPAGGDPDYHQAANWIARPDRRDDPSRWLPAGLSPATDAGKIPVFYVGPTTYLGKDRWNAPIANDEAFSRARLFAASQGSVFNGVGVVWSPRYRSATIGAFLTSRRDAALAFDFAYRDVARAFDAFLAGIPTGAPFLLAGHSQGSLHLLRLIHDRIAGKALARRVAAVYAIGWPISIAADLPALGLPACERADQARCIVAYQSFAEPADPLQILDVYDATRGFTGRSRQGTAMLCVDPITGTTGQAPSPAASNPGSLVPSADFTTGHLVAALAPARCDARGLLLIGAGPDGYGRFVLPGNNYHVFDYALFWASLRADVARRVATFRAR